MTRPRRLRARLLLSLAAACVAAYAFAGHAAASESRAARALDLPEGRSAPFAVLLQPDVVRYRQIFELQRAGRFDQADKLVDALDDPVLLGHVLAERYLHRRYHSDFDELADWLNRYGDLPQAARLYRLANARMPPRHKPLPDPPGGSLKGAGQELREECYSDAFLHRMDAGLDAWRKGDYATAAARFGALAGNSKEQTEELAAAAFWAARAQLRAKHPEGVAPMLRRAARASDGFYGLLAQRLLDETISFDWRREEFRDEMAGLLLRYPTVKRAIALGQVGETDLAEAEVRKLALHVGTDSTQALTALAAALELPSAQMRLAQQLRLVDGRRHDGAMFPIPRWEPRTGFRLDRTLVYAVIRAESAFDIEAVSPRGALGLMQVMPDNGAIVARGLKLAYAGKETLFEPEVNLEIGQTWMRRLMHTDTVGTSLIHLVLAYNAGEMQTKRWLDKDLRPVGKDPLLFIESIPAPESRNYVKKVLANLWAYQTRLGEPTPSLQALAENHWPQVGSLIPADAPIRPKATTAELAPQPNPAKVAPVTKRAATANARAH